MYKNTAKILNLNLQRLWSFYSLFYLKQSLANITQSTNLDRTILTSGQRILIRGRIAWGFFIGKIQCDTRLLLRPANRNAGRQRAGKSRRHSASKGPLPLGGNLDPIYYIVPSAHPNPHPKRHLDRFGRFAGIMVVNRQTD